MKVLLAKGTEAQRISRWLSGSTVIVVEDVKTALAGFCDGWEKQSPFDVVVVEGRSPWARLAVARFRHVERLLGVDVLHPIRVVVVNGAVAQWPGTARADAFVRSPLSERFFNDALEGVGLLAPA